MSPARRPNENQSQAVKGGLADGGQAKGGLMRSNKRGLAKQLTQKLAGSSSRSGKSNKPGKDLERSLAQLHETLGHCTTRIEALEKRVKDLSDNAEAGPSHTDVMEVRLHSAKLAAELARATVELRGEIGMANEEARRAARMSRDIAEHAIHNTDQLQHQLSEQQQANSNRRASDSGDARGEDKPKRGGWSASA